VARYFLTRDPDAAVDRRSRLLQSNRESMWTAFILYSHALFARGLESLLAAAQGVIVTGVEPTGEKALARIEALSPDVIIIECDPYAPEAENLLSRFMPAHPRTVIVRLNLQNNTAILYSARPCTADSVEDLLESVLSSLTARR
jgi:DNA-binding NarL/FixJ family response regulator